MIGKKFNRLTVINFDHKNNKSFFYFKCVCICGKEIIIRKDRLLNENTKSCGCLKKELSIKRNKNLFIKHKMCKTKFYRIWVNIKARINYLNCNQFKNYGGRGISYDPRWNDFLNFYKDMYFKYLYAMKQLKIKKPSIERINVNGNYEFNNCIFIEIIDQPKNTRKNKIFKSISPEGEIYISKNQNEFARQHNLIQSCISICLSKNRTHRGWVFKFI